MNKSVIYGPVLLGNLFMNVCRFFWKTTTKLLNGTFSKSLIGSLSGKQAQAMKKVKEISFSEIYAHRSVVEIEIAGYKIIGTLLEDLWGPVHPENLYSKKILSLLPEQYKTEVIQLYPQNSVGC